jgi:hypothetical protein
MRGDDGTEVVAFEQHKQAGSGKSLTLAAIAR